MYRSVQDREHYAVRERIEKLVGVPGGRQRAGFRLTVADHTGHDQVGIVVRGPVHVRNGVTQFASFVNGSRSLGRHMARDATRERELGEQPLHSLFVLCDVRIDLGVGPFQVGIGDDAGPPWPGPII